MSITTIANIIAVVEKLAGRINIKIKNGIEFDIKLVVSYCPEVEDVPCDQLFEESYIEFYKIN